MHKQQVKEERTECSPHREKAVRVRDQEGSLELNRILWTGQDYPTQKLTAAVVAYTIPAHIKPTNILSWSGKGLTSPHPQPRSY